MNEPQSQLLNERQLQLLDELAELVTREADIPKEYFHHYIVDMTEKMAAYRALPSSQIALDKAEAKRQRKAAKLAQQLGQSN